jgi:PAP2 superfamily
MRTVAAVPFVVSLLCFGSTADADVVTDWNSAALSAVRTNRTSPPLASRALAMLHVAIYDAVNGISRTHDSYRVVSAVRSSASEEAAASAAAQRILVALFPSSTALFTELHARILVGIPEGQRRDAGLAWGESVAAAILAWRSTDNWDVMVPPLPWTRVGDWEPTLPALAPFLLPQWAFVEPFAMPTSASFRPVGPPELTSSKYTEAFDEVKALGAAVGSSRTSEQDQIALFWADGAGTETPPGHWNSIAQDVALRLANTVEQNARLFALLNIAMADAAICAWDAKYYFHNWRPITAIRNGDSDGNDSTAGDPAWTSFITTPPFPDYVSGHSTFSGAASTVLATFYGSDQIAFTARSDFLPGVTRDFTSFSAAAAEAAESRLYGGIHFRFSNEDGLKGGLEIGEWTSQLLQPKGNRSRK